MKQLSAIILALALTACVNPGTGEKEPETGLLWQYITYTVECHPGYCDSIQVAEGICEDFRERLYSRPDIFDGSAFILDGVKEADGKTAVCFAYDGSGVRLRVHCNDFDREKAMKLMGGEHFIIKGYEVVDYKPITKITRDCLDLGDVFVRDLHVEEI